MVSVSPAAVNTALLLLNVMCILKYVYNYEQNFSYFNPDYTDNCNRISEVLLYFAT
jgi:hypothetical protein